MLDRTADGLAALVPADELARPAAALVRVSLSKDAVKELQAA